jgi:hypothetical protein
MPFSVFGLRFSVKNLKSEPLAKVSSRLNFYQSAPKIVGGTGFPACAAQGAFHAPLYGA